MIAQHHLCPKDPFRVPDIALLQTYSSTGSGT